MGLFRVQMMMLFCKSLLLLYLLGTNSVTADDIAAEANPPSPPPPPPAAHSSMAPFKPSIAVVVGVLTTMFSITFLLLLYAKHCKRGNGGYSNNSRGRGAAPSASRKNSGVDRTVIESLPIFRFGSLRGEKDGLECAVCLSRFEPAEILRLLPKCKHAFHVECVDTWLDAHSTCPLCRYRVDPEDILLINDHTKILALNEPPPPSQPPCEETLRRVSGRHSSAGERETGSSTSSGYLQIVLQKPVDSSEIKHGNGSGGGSSVLTTRRSLDSWNLMRGKKKSDVVSVGCFDRRKDGMLLTADEGRTSAERRRLEHRIIIGGGAGGGGGSGFQHRWSDVQPSDLLYLRSEMIMSDSRRFSASGSRPSMSRHQQQNHLVLHVHGSNDGQQGGRSVINGRSMSEITGLSRLSTSNYDHHHHHRGNYHRQRRRQAGLVSRWLAWISQSQSSQTETQQQQTETQTQPAVGS